MFLSYKFAGGTAPRQEKISLYKNLAGRASQIAVMMKLKNKFQINYKNCLKNINKVTKKPKIFFFHS